MVLELHNPRLAPSIVATITGINAKTVATTTLYTVPAGRTLVVTDVIVRCTAFTVGSKSIQAVANIGGNSTSFNDFLNAKTYTISAAGQLKRENVNDTQVVTYAAGVAFSINITTGSNATTETWAVDVIGYFV